MEKTRAFREERKIRKGFSLGGSEKGAEIAIFALKSPHGERGPAFDFSHSLPDAEQSEKMENRLCSDLFNDCAWDAPQDAWSASERQALADWIDAAWGLRGLEMRAQPNPEALDTMQAVWAACGAFDAGQIRAVGVLARIAAKAAADGDTGKKGLWEAPPAKSPDTPAVKEINNISEKWSRVMWSALNDTTEEEWEATPAGRAPAVLEALSPIAQINPDWPRQIAHWAADINTQTGKQDIPLRLLRWLVEQGGGVEQMDASGLLGLAGDSGLAWLMENNVKFTSQSIGRLIGVGEEKSKPERKPGGKRGALGEADPKKGERLLRELKPCQLPAYGVEIGAAALRCDGPWAWEWVRKTYYLTVVDAVALVHIVARRAASEKIDREENVKRDEDLPDDKRRENQRAVIFVRLARLATLFRDLSAQGKGLSVAGWSALAETLSERDHSETMVRWCLSQGASPKGSAAGGGLLKQCLFRRDFGFAEKIAALGGWGPAAEKWINETERLFGVGDGTVWERWRSEARVRWERRQLAQTVEDAQDTEKKTVGHESESGKITPVRAKRI